MSKKLRTDGNRIITIATEQRLIKMVIEKQMSIWLFSVDYIKVSVENKKIKVIKLKKAIKILKNGKLTAVHAEVMKGYSELGLS